MSYENKTREELISEIEFLKLSLNENRLYAEDGASNRDVRRIVDALPVHIFGYDVEPDEKYKIVYMNKSPLLRIEQDSPEGLYIDGCYSPEDLVSIKRHLAKCVESGHQYENKQRFQGSDTVFCVRLLPLKDKNGKVFRVIGSIRDAAELPSACNMSTLNDEFYSLLLSSLPDVVLLHDGGTIKYINKSVKTVFGYDPEALVGLSVFSFMNEDDALRLSDYHRRRMMSEDVPDTYETKINHKNGKSIAVEIRVSSLNPEPSDVRLIVVTDITEKKKSSEIEERFRNLAEMLPETIYETDEKGSVVYVNSAGKKLFGYDDDVNPSDFHMSNVFPEDELPKVLRSRDSTIGKSEIRRMSFNAKRKDGSVFPVMIHTVPLIINNEICGTRGIIIDLTDQKKEEEYRLRIIKLESVGILAGGIAHDFNNILTSILGNITLSRMTLPESHEAHELLSDAERAAFRAKSLTQQMLTLSLGGNPVKRNSSIGALLEECSSFVLRGSAISCEIHMPPEIPLIHIDEGQIFQVFNNLIINSMQAMPGGGKIKISGSSEYLQEDNVQRLVPGYYLKITVADTGTGISKENVQKIFDPYFTTKQNGHGLGLSTTYSIIMKHGGSIDVVSQPGNTVFTVYLPQITGVDANTDSPRPLKNISRIKLLILEDDESISFFLEKLFQKWNYYSVFTKDGKDTVEEYRSTFEAGDPFDAVILDLTIQGGMGGNDTLRHIQKINPGVKAIASSGYFNDSSAADPDKLGFSAHIAKPFQINELKSIIMSVI